MKQVSLILAGASLLLLPGIALAQTNAPPAASQATPPAVNANAGNPGALREHLRAVLQSSGFSDIRMMPSSFVIRAKDQDGVPVVMSVSPDSVTEVAEMGSTSSADTATNLNTPAQGASQFVSIAKNDDLTSNLMGLDVYNSSNQNIGQIKDVAFGPRGHAQAYILSVGGFLGMGERYVAVNPSDVRIAYNESDKKWHATTNATPDQLKSAPEFKYNGRWNASRS